MQPDLTSYLYVNPKTFMQNSDTYLTARGLAAYAGTSVPVVRRRIDSGHLKPAALLSNGTWLFTYDQAPALAPVQNSKSEK